MVAIELSPKQVSKAVTRLSPMLVPAVQAKTAAASGCVVVVMIAN